MPVGELWREYSQTRSWDARNSLVLEYLDLVRNNAVKVHAKLPSSVVFDDLVSAGTFGLIKAVERFDVNRGVRFETFAALRIRGAMFDELREYDRVPRLVRRRRSSYEKARAELEKSYGAELNREEIRRHMNLSEEEFQRVERDARVTSESSIDAVVYKSEDSDRQVRGRHVLADDNSGPYDLAARKDFVKYLIKDLARRDRIILSLRYYEGMTFAEIGETLEITESGAQAAFYNILTGLKGKLSGQYEDLVA